MLQLQGNQEGWLRQESNPVATNYLQLYRSSSPKSGFFGTLYALETCRRNSHRRSANISALKQLLNYWSSVKRVILGTVEIGLYFS